MISRNFIFSNKIAIRIRRHLLFWLFWWFYFATMHAANPMGNPKIAYFQNLPFTLTESIVILVPHVVITYYMLYFVMVKFILKNRYWQAFLWAIPGWFVTVLFSLYLVNNVNAQILSFFLPERYMQNAQRLPSVSFFMSLMNVSKGALTVAAMAVAIKFIKHWYQKEERNQQLQKQNAEAQLRLLTAQVHPHFLFNTLNNIYSQTQTESPKGSAMIMELSDLLRYILTEGNKPAVPLRKELDMIVNYIELERIRYGNKLDLHLSLPEETATLGIAPLLLLPFVENCFKHGASKFLKSPWVNLKIEVAEYTLIMKLMNGKDDSQPSAYRTTGTGVDNVRQRLALLYPDRHQLEIINEEDVFIVNLRLELTKYGEKTPTEVKNRQTTVYAN